MIKRSDKGSHDYLLSLNDTLTCGFGASLILFFVFAVLVVFEEAGRSMDGVSGLLANASGRALTSEEIAGDAQLYLRIYSSDKKFIQAIEVPQSDSWNWQAEPLIGRSTEPGLLVLHWAGAIPPPLKFTVPDGMTGTLTMTGMLGGTLLTPEVGTRYVHLRGTDLFTVNIRAAEPIKFGDEL